MMCDLVIFSGQSNMQGQTERLPDSNDPVDNAFEYRFADDALVPLRHPVGEDIDVNGRLFQPDHENLTWTLRRSALLSSWRGKANMVPSFARRYTKATGHRFVAVHAAKGSTVIDQWMPGSVSCEALISKSKAAIRRTAPDRVFFVWLQGESDALAGTDEATYRQKLIRLKNTLKRELGIERFGIILVGDFADDARDAEIQNAQRSVCETDGDFLMLTDVTQRIVHEKAYLNPSARAHFNCAGQELIGDEAAKALAAFVNTH